MSVDTYDCEPFTVDRTSQHRARKEHQCCACRGTIERGQLYTYSFTIHDGETNELRRCAKCDAIYAHLCELHKDCDGDEWPDWSLNCGHTYSERWGKEPPPDIARLAFMTAAEVLAEGIDTSPKGGKYIAG